MTADKLASHCIASCLAVLVWAGFAGSVRADGRLLGPCPEGRVRLPEARHLHDITPNWREWPKERRPDMTIPSPPLTEARLTPEEFEHVSTSRYPVSRDGRETPAAAPMLTESVILPAGIELRFKADPSSQRGTPREPKASLPGLPLTPETPLTWSPPAEEEPSSKAPALPRIVKGPATLGPGTMRLVTGSSRWEGSLPGSPGERIALATAPPSREDLAAVGLNPLAPPPGPPPEKRGPVEGRVVEPRGPRPLRIRVDEPASGDRGRVPTPVSPPRTTELAAPSRAPVSAVWNRQLATPNTQPSRVSQVDWMPDLTERVAVGRPQRKAGDPSGCPAPVQQCSDPFKPRTEWGADHREGSSPRPANSSPGLKGYCPVALLDNGAWVRGDPRWTVVHRGRTYLLSGPRQKQLLLANPDRYCPVLGGDDPVMLVDEGQRVEGDLDYAVICEGRIYLFSGPYPRARFRQNPRRYACDE